MDEHEQAIVEKQAEAKPRSIAIAARQYVDAVDLQLKAYRRKYQLDGDERQRRALQDEALDALRNALAS